MLLQRSCTTVSKCTVKSTGTHVLEEPHAIRTFTCVITRSSIRFCGRVHSNPNSASFITGSPAFRCGGPAFTQSTCGLGGKQMWERQRASLASQTSSAASCGDPVRHQRCRPSFNHVSTGFSCPSVRITSVTLICNLIFPDSKRSEVSERDSNWSCICFSCLSTSQ